MCRRYTVNRRVTSLNSIHNPNCTADVDCQEVPFGRERVRPPGNGNMAATGIKPNVGPNSGTSNKESNKVSKSD